MGKNWVILYFLIAAAHFVVSVVAYAYTFSSAMEGVAPTPLANVVDLVAQILMFPLVIQAQSWFAFILNSLVWAALLTLAVRLLSRWRTRPKVAA